MEKNRIKEYFNFSKRERNGIMALFILLLFIFLLPKLFPMRPTFSAEDLKQFRKEIAALSDSLNIPKHAEDVDVAPQEKPFYQHVAPYGSPPNLFSFDPNILSTAGWKKLGVSDKTIRTVQNFLSHGGRFRNPEDLRKIYGMRDTDVERLLPYVVIAISDSVKQSKSISFAGAPKNRKEFPKDLVDLNTADSTRLSSLPGIGEKLASRILRFREKLGGYYSVEQLSEIYGMKDSTCQILKLHVTCSRGMIRKIDLNKTDYETLRSHPYFKNGVARAIIQYRSQHGPFLQISDLEKIGAVDPQTLKIIVPYVTIE